MISFLWKVGGGGGVREAAGRVLKGSFDFEATLLKDYITNTGF